jgi:DNA-binding winged helix-turn-helix (wHTH) protein
MGSITFLTGAYQEGAQLAAKALAHPDATDLALLMANRTSGYTAALDGDIERAQGHLEQTVEIAKQYSASFAREAQIARAAIIVDPAESQAALGALADVHREAADNHELVMVVWSGVTSAYHHILMGDIASDRQAADDAIAIADSSGLSWAASTAHRCVASIRVIEHGWDAGAPHFREALEATLSVGDIDGIAMVLRAAAGAARLAGQHERAARLWSTIPARPGRSVPPSLFQDFEQELFDELGPPPPMDADTRVSTARRLLALTAADEPTKTPDGLERQHAISVVRFGDYELDTAMAELRHSGERVPMEPQVYYVLALLVVRRGTMVSKNDLLDEVWGDRFVSESALSSRIAAARRATGDDGKTQRVIRTVHGKGFSFIADVQ